jgi:hypothetical protein
MAKKVQLSALRGLFEQALDEINEQGKDRAGLKKPGDAFAWGYGQNEWPGYPAQRLPPECPVTPLGVDGTTTYFVDPLGQMIAVRVKDQSNAMLHNLFKTETEYLHHHWAAWDNKAGPDGTGGWSSKKIEMQAAWNCLTNVASRKGVFDPMLGVRGRGGWKAGTENAFVWHAGNRIWTMDNGKLVQTGPGEIDGIYYALRSSVMEPWKAEVTRDDGPGAMLLDHLQNWNFERPKLDPLLFLGWMGSALYGAALDWRPWAMTIGDKGVGKSSLQVLQKDLFGPAIHSSANITAAGIYNHLRSDALPVGLDEFENTPDNAGRVQQIIELARQGSSGGMGFRGGADGVGSSFQIRNSFFFSMINPPPMGNQDRSRTVFFDMRRLDAASRAPKLPMAGHALGSMMLRLMMQEWHLFNDLLADWDETLRQAGFDGRQRQTYGTVLAAGHLLAGDAALETLGLPVNDRPALGSMIKSALQTEMADVTDNWRECLEHLFSAVIALWAGGEKPVIGDVLFRLLNNDANMNLADARARLRSAGLGLVEARGWTGRPGYLLGVPKAASGPLASIFDRSKWHGGVWSSALKQAPDQIVIRPAGRKASIRIGVSAVCCTLIDINAYAREFGGLDEIEPALPAELEEIF